MAKGERNSCPICGSIRIRKKNICYKCDRCGWTGKNVKKIVWFFGIPYVGGSPPVGRTRVNGVRERHYCPNCESVRIRKRIITRDYFCDNCKWIGSSPKRMKWGVC